MHKNVEKKIHFTRQLIIHLIVKSRGAPDGTFDVAPKDALSDLHKDEQEGVFELPLKDALEVPLELHLWLHFLMQSLMHKYVQNSLSNGGPDAALEGAFDGGLNVGLEWVPY